MRAQLAPFPYDLIRRELRRYPNAEVLWCQEEPMNMGGYTHVVPRFDTCLRAEHRPSDGRWVNYIAKKMNLQIVS